MYICGGTQQYATKAFKTHPPFVSYYSQEFALKKRVDECTKTEVPGDSPVLFIAETYPNLPNNGKTRSL